jgi:hypothetical protein
LIERGRKRIVQGLLGAIEVADEANERRQHAPGLGSIELFDPGPDARRRLVSRISHL